MMDAVLVFPQAFVLNAAKLKTPGWAAIYPGARSSRQAGMRSSK